MDDKSIYDLAVRIIDGIREDFQRVNYSELGGELKVIWATECRFTASAHSQSDPNRAPQHAVRLTYELARQIYRDGEDFYEFLTDGIELYAPAFLAYEPPSAPPAPSSFNKEEFQNNYFAAALSWVFAHEVGHLTQEHGYIRSKFGGSSQMSAEIHECAVMNPPSTLSPRAAAISHVTELAADYEATNWCFFELARQLSKQDDFGTELFTDGVFVFICAITCTFYRFNGLVAIEPPKEPVGAHPHSIFRVEKNISHLIELLDHMRDAVNVNLSRKELVHFYHRAATAASFFWFSQHARPEAIPQEFIIGGAINHSNMREYMPKIFTAWDEVEPEIKAIKRFVLGLSKEHSSKLPDLGLMTFTKDLRERFT